jgi:hypothetical protein
VENLKGGFAPNIQVTAFSQVIDASRQKPIASLDDVHLGDHRRSDDRETFCQSSVT